MLFQSPQLVRFRALIIAFCVGLPSFWQLKVVSWLELTTNNNDWLGGEGNHSNSISPSRYQKKQRAKHFMDGPETEPPTFTSGSI